MNADPAIMRRQRLATYLVIAITAAALGAGALLRVSVEDATFPFIDQTTGITARYPANWLIERGSARAEYVMRAQDPAALPFKTTLAIAVLPIGPDATVYDVTEYLTVKRAASLSSYRSLDIMPTRLPNGTPATQMRYAYAASENNPSLKSLPIAVSATDVIVLTKGQAIIISYLADVGSFDHNQHYFAAFLRRLELK